jgi:hypothetical protein
VKGGRRKGMNEKRDKDEHSTSHINIYFTNMIEPNKGIGHRE